ncbi:MAG: hypothetical protein QOI04_443 [Verrucomicrobiota bacterium]|jgi:uncharacterized iron-regulated membrane protein
MKLRNIILEALTLFSTFGTLLCCALPALLVSIGAGAALASIVSTVPQLVWISEHKMPLFIFAGLMLLVSGVFAYWNRRAPCPLDPVQAKSCRRVRRVSFALLLVSLVIYATGFYFAFLAVGGS